jgi:hypothetical protein
MKKTTRRKRRRAAPAVAAAPTPATVPAMTRATPMKKSVKIMSIYKKALIPK